MPIFCPISFLFALDFLLFLFYFGDVRFVVVVSGGGGGLLKTELYTDNPIIAIYLFIYSFDVKYI